MSADYPVGYKKPPKHSQFKKGRSGNPKGRPRKKNPERLTMNIDLRTELVEVMESKVSIMRDGEKVTVPAIIALYYQVLYKGIKGDFRSQKLAIDLYCSVVNDQTTDRMDLVQLLMERDTANGMTLEQQALKYLQGQWIQRDLPPFTLPPIKN